MPMELLKFINNNPNVIKIAKNCKSQNDLHKLIVQNKIDLNHISETELFNIIKETRKQDEEVEDEILENVAGGVSNKIQRKIQDGIKNEVDPNEIKLTTSTKGLTATEVGNRTARGGPPIDKYMYDPSNGLYFEIF